VDEQRQAAGAVRALEVEQEQLAAAADPLDRRALDRGQWRVVRLEHVDARRERRLDALAGQRLPQQARRHLDLGQLWHRAPDCSRRYSSGGRRRYFT
jgi:hypothetical protein